MRFSKNITLVLFTALLFSCEKEVITLHDSVLKADSSITLKSTSNLGSFILISKTNQLPKNLERKLNAVNGKLIREISEVGIASVQSDDPKFALKASKINGVRSVIPNLKSQMIDPGEFSRSVSANVSNPPNSGNDDPLFDLQWGHDAIDAQEAWEAGFRGKGVRVAVLDTGFDLEHPDLIPNINLNLSRDFTGEGLQFNIDNGFSHGSHTAGTIAAADNEFGIIGVAPEAELVLLKVLNDEGNGATFDILNAIIYAALNDVDVINMSFGAVGKRRGEPGFYTARDATELISLYTRVTNFAYQQGITMIASAGNESTDYNHAADLGHVPSQLPNVISVSATGPNGWALNPNTNLDLPAFYTNYGSKVIDFAGPGGNVDFDLFDSEILAIVAGLERPAFVFDLVFSTDIEGYAWSAGTSMSAPHVAGVAALIIGKNGGSMHPAQVKAALKASTDDLGKPGKDDFYGSGRVNAYRAVSN